MTDTKQEMSAVERLQAIKGQLAATAKAAGRAADATTLIAVSKTFDPEHIEPVLAAGHENFGENRIQEAQSKWPDLKAKYPDTKLHLIGPLQSNKTKEAVALFDAIHSIDRPKIAKAVAAEMTRQDRALELFVQVNTGEEPQKAGVMPVEVKSFVDQCRSEFGLRIKGLMCIPPANEEPAIHFAFLAKLAGDCGVTGLSMGMSGDYETAIRFGASHVRVGSAIFGTRG